VFFIFYCMNQMKCLVFLNMQLFRVTLMKLDMTVEIVGDCHMFHSALDRLNEWCLENKFDLNV
jgi:hypothetical protein